MDLIFFFPKKCFTCAEFYFFRFNTEDKTPFPCFVCLTPKVSAELNLDPWIESRKNSVILYPIPEFVHMVVKFSSRTAFHKISSGLNKIMCSRLVNSNFKKKLGPFSMRTLVFVVFIVRHLI